MTSKRQLTNLRLEKVFNLL